MTVKINKNKKRITKRNPPLKRAVTRSQTSEDMKLEDSKRLQSIVLSKQDAGLKPKLSIMWPLLMAISVLSCIGIPFIPFAERILLVTIATCFSIIAVFMNFRFEKSLQRWYVKNPEFSR